MTHKYARNSVSASSQQAMDRFTPTRDTRVPARSMVACPICHAVKGDPCHVIDDESRPAQTVHRARRIQAIRILNKAVTTPNQPKEKS